MKHEIGDKVTIRDDLEEDKRYKMSDSKLSNYIAQPMANMKGRTAEITKVYEYGYRIDIDNSKFIWTDSMFEDGNHFPFAIITNKKFNNCDKCYAVDKCEIFKKIYNNETPCGMVDLIHKLGE